MKSAKSISAALVALAVSCLLAIAVGQDSTTPQAGAGAKTAEDVDYDAIAKQKLAKVVDKVEFKDKPLEDVFQYFRDASGVSIFVKWGALETPGIEKATSVNVHLTNVTIEKALRCVLEDVSEAAYVGYVIDQGVITISTMEDLNNITITKLYPVGDLINQTRATYTTSEGWPWRTSSFMSEAAETDNNGGGGGFFEGPPDEAPEYGQAARKLMDLISDVIEPETWRCNDGEYGCIKLYETNLIITQTRSNHELIEHLLQKLREDRTLSVGVAVVRMSRADSRAKLDEFIKNGGDIKAVLLAGEKKGLWTLDRCELENAAFGEVIGATQIYEHYVESSNGEVLLTLFGRTGYELGVLAKQRTDGGVLMSVACGAGWYAKGHDPQKDTPEKNAGVTKRHNVFDFTLAAGEAKTFSMIPFDVRGDAAVAVVWLPKAAGK